MSNVWATFNKRSEVGEAGMSCARVISTRSVLDIKSVREKSKLGISIVHRVILVMVPGIQSGLL